MKSSLTNEPHLTQGSVLDDLGFSPSEALEIKVKAEIYRDLLQYIREQKFAQQDLCARLAIHQPDASNLLNGKISRFSLGKLIQFAGKLNLEAHITLSKPKSSGLASKAASRGEQDRIPTLT